MGKSNRSTVTRPITGADGAAAVGNGGPHDGNGVERTVPAPGPAETPTTVAAAAGTAPVVAPGSIKRRPPSLSVASALWLLLLVLAAVTRFWDLGSRALHHDESLHAIYSYDYAIGNGYVHDPLMHGPFLFHVNALVYWLFGDSDASSRWMPALFGVILVGLPWLLRGPHHLGQWGALAAGTLLLFSPALLYMSRYIRHDIFTVVGSLLLFTAIVRYLENPERRWLVTAGATLGFLLTNHELIFGIAAIFFGVLWGTLLWGRLRPTIPFHIGWAAVAGIVLLIVRGRAGPLPEIPWDRRGVDSPQPTQENQIAFYKDLLVHPLFITGVALLAIFVVGLVLIARRLRDPARLDQGAITAIFGEAPPHAVETGIVHAWRDRPGLAAAAASGALIFIVLFTSFFSNLRGLATSTVATDGTLLYWLGQHEVRRGEQPWFYYLLLLPQYEFIAVLFGGAGVLLTAVAVWRGLRGRAVGERFYFRLFLATWFVGIFAALSWAGEKMPWLVTHIALPATLLAASVIGEAIERVLAWRQARGEAALSRRVFGRPELALGAALLVAGGCWLLLAARLSYGTFIPSSEAADGGWERAVTQRSADHWWWLALPPLAALALIGASWIVRGSRQTAAAALGALLIGLLLLQIHAGWRMSYDDGDVPRDMMIYTQTSPDVPQMVADLRELSAEVNGDTSLDVYYDSGVSWPMRWYLRDFGGGFRSSPSSESGAAVLIEQQSWSDEPSPREGYVAQGYVLRWWFPEYGIYRNFAIAPELPPGKSAWQGDEPEPGLLDVARSIVDSFATQLEPDGQQRVYRLLMYRDLPEKIDSFRYVVYIRDDLVPIFNQIRYGT